MEERSSSSSSSASAADGPLFIEVASDMELLSLYTIGPKIGDGGCSSVHKARDVKSQRELAIKIVPKESTLRGSVELEGRILKMCSGAACVVQLLAAYESPKNFYLVQEWVAGGDLFDRIVAKELQRYAEQDARVLIHNILSCVAFIHSKNIAHRDVKPENILLLSSSSDVDIKLSDFGLAKMVGASVGDRGGLMTPCGTPGYVAPEIAEHQPYDKSVDCWAVGVIMYTVLCGYPPFWASNAEKLLELVAKGHFVFHARPWRNTSRESRELIKGLLRKSPTKRLTAEQALQHPWFTHTSLGSHLELKAENCTPATVANNTGSNGHPNATNGTAIRISSSAVPVTFTPLSSSVSLVSASPDLISSPCSSLSQLMGSAPVSNTSVYSAAATPLEQATPPRSSDNVNLVEQQLALQKMTLPASLSESPPSSPSVQLLNESPPTESSSDLALSKTLFDAAIDFHREQRPFLHSVTESNLWERRKQKRAAADKTKTNNNGKGSAPNVSAPLDKKSEKSEPKKPNETSTATTTIIMKSDSVLENLNETNHAALNVSGSAEVARGDPRSWKSTSS